MADLLFFLQNCIYLSLMTQTELINAKSAARVPCRSTLGEMYDTSQPVITALLLAPIRSERKDQMSCLN